MKKFCVATTLTQTVPMTHRPRQNRAACVLAPLAGAPRRGAAAAGIDVMIA